MTHKRMITFISSVMFSLSLVLGLTQWVATAVAAPDFSSADQTKANDLTSDGGTAVDDGPAPGTRALFNTSHPWIVVSQAPNAVSRPGGTVVGDLFYILGGESSGGNYNGRVQIYDPDTDTWDNTAPTMPTAVSNICAAALGTDIYVPGGWNGNARTTLRIFHTITNTWSTVATDPLPSAQIGMACTTYNDKIYLFGGSDGSNVNNNAWVYDPAATAGSRWTTLTSTPENGGWGAALAINDLIYYGGYINNSSTNQNDVYAYDPVTDSWITYPTLQQARGGAGMWADGDTLIIGGGGWNNYRTSVEAYDTSLGTGGSWEFIEPLNQGRRTFAFGTDSINGRIFAAAGWSGSFMSSAETNSLLNCFTEYTGDGVTDFATYDGTALQSAVDAATAGGTVKVAGTCSGVQARNGFTQTLYLDKTLLIQGGYSEDDWLADSDPNTYPTVLDAEEQGRVVFVPYNTITSDIVLDGLTIINGNTFSNPVGICGSGGNQGGGGVCLGSANNPTIMNSIIRDNSADDGGGIYRHGGGNSLTLINSTVMNNSAAGVGGGIYQRYNDLMLDSSTVYSNSAIAAGGGIYLSRHTLEMINSTVSGNTSDGNGGGLFVNQFDVATTFIDSSTIVSNTTNGNGGGISNGSGVITITNTIVANNIDTNGSAPDCIGAFVSADYNLVEDVTGCGFTPQTNDMTGVDPLLDVLAENLNDTWTHAPLPGSPALDAIPDLTNGCGTTITDDQRGMLRPYDGACEIGAYEEGDFPPTAANDTYSTTENVTLSVAAPGVLANDSDREGTTLTAVLGSGPSNGSLSFNSDGSFVYTPTNGFDGTDTFTYQASDGLALSNQGIVTLTVINNIPPVANSDLFTTSVDVVLTAVAPGVLVNDTDAEGDPLTAVLNTGPSNGSISFNNDGSFVYTPTASFVGVDSFTYWAEDGIDPSNTATAVINVYDNRCFTEWNGDNTTDFASYDAGAVQMAIDAAPVSSTVKIAGTCPGAESRAGVMQTAYISKSLTLQGGYDGTDWMATPDPDTYPTILDGDEVGRVVYVTGDTHVTLSGLTISGGDYAAIGGGIYHDGNTLTITHSLVTNNVGSSHGGGVINNGKTLWVLNSIFSGNQAAGGRAGAVYNNGGTATISDVTFAGNSAANGGAIYNISDGQVTVSNSTFYSNTVTGDGGAIQNNASGAVITLTNSTLSGNYAGDDGGGLYNNNGTTNVIHVTLNGNEANDIGGNIRRNGGTVNISNSIVANDISGNDCSGTINDNGYNIASDASCNFSATGSLTNTNPLLEPLGDNGGETWTYALQLDSPAADHIPAQDCLVTADQRGVVRPQGDLCDVGAYELAYQSLQVTLAGSGSGYVSSIPAAIDCGLTCTADLFPSSMITLTAVEDVGSTFTGWSGDCAGSGSCVITMDMARNVTATFTLLQYDLVVTPDGEGSGLITSVPAGINCPNDCNEMYDYGTVVTLTAVAEVGSIFTGWSGDCTGTTSCVMSITQTRAVTATFAINDYDLNVTVDGNGTGTVTSDPNGINCPGDCTEPYAYGSVVTLTAAYDSNASALVWGGACAAAGSDTCVVTIDLINEVTATFSLNQYSLGVTIDGDGSGSVTSTPAGIDCQTGGGQCTAAYDYGTVVTLTAVAYTGTTFVGWSGSCTGTSDCVITMDSAKNVTATFALDQHQLNVTLAGSGTGAVTSLPPGIDCGLDCSESYGYGTVVTLTAVADIGSTFTGWAGICTGTDDCIVTMDEAKSVTATFAFEQHELNVMLDGTGGGTVTSMPAGIDCGADCSESYDYGTVVTLTAVAELGSTFAGWSGACTGTGTCVVTVDMAQTITATFTLEQTGYSIYLPLIVRQ